MKQDKLLPYEEVYEDPEFPDSYTIQTKIKSPLSVLKYNLNFLFEDDYPAKMNADFARDMILMYSHEGDLVWDGCCGSGTVPIIASGLRRLGMGTDVNPKAIDLAKQHATEHNFLTECHFTVADARTSICLTKPDLILSSLPFGLNIAGDKNHYSEDPLDISNSVDYNQFFHNAEKIIQNYFNQLKGGGICILDARDRTTGGVLYDLVNYFRNFAIIAGFQIIARYYIEQPPYRMMTYRHKPTKFVMPMVDAMDAIVLYKPTDQKLQ